MAADNHTTIVGIWSRTPSSALLRAASPWPTCGSL
jgi:hypothetical protein